MNTVPVGCGARRALNRRDFVCLAGLAAAGAALFPGGQEGNAAEVDKPKETLVGSNIYGWTQYAARDKKPLDIGEVIAALADAGYDYLENFMNLDQPEENARFADRLRAKGLRPVSLYTGARLHEPGKSDDAIRRILAAAAVCQKAGFEVLSCNPDPIGRAKTDEELKHQAAALEKLGGGLKDLGIRLGIHHHLPEMADQAREFHYNFRNTRAERVGFCYDVHWVWKGGTQPLDALREYGQRVVSWHLRQSRDGVWWEDLDTGDVDYAVVAAYAREHRLPRRFTVELALEPGTQITRSAVENHRRSREFVRRVFEA
jgi:inosose dehydratase